MGGGTPARSGWGVTTAKGYPPGVPPTRSGSGTPPRGVPAWGTPYQVRMGATPVRGHPPGVPPMPGQDGGTTRPGKDGGTQARGHLFGVPSRPGQDGGVPQPGRDPPGVPPPMTGQHMEYLISGTHEDCLVFIQFSGKIDQIINECPPPSLRGCASPLEILDPLLACSIKPVWLLNIFRFLHQINKRISKFKQKKPMREWHFRKLK